MRMRMEVVPEQSLLIFYNVKNYLLNCAVYTKRRRAMTNCSPNPNLKNYQNEKINLVLTVSLIYTEKGVKVTLYFYFFLKNFAGILPGYYDWL